jgi:hypothetical protein
MQSIILFILLGISSVYAAMDCSVPTPQIMQIYYNEPGCEVSKCYDNHCKCLGSSITLNNTCLSDSSTCETKNTCAISFLQCLNNTFETNSSQLCLTRLASYRTYISNVRAHYIYCESLMCTKFNFSRCENDPCSEFLKYVPSVSGNTTTTTTQIPVSSVSSIKISSLVSTMFLFPTIYVLFFV